MGAIIQSITSIEGQFQEKSLGVIICWPVQRAANMDKYLKSGWYMKICWELAAWVNWKGSTIQFYELETKSGRAFILIFQFVVL